MLKAEGGMEIAVLKKHGQSIRAIARAMGVSRNTVRVICAAARKLAFANRRRSG
jgi:transposase